MLDIELVNNTIEELENSETNFTNCNNLASLYIIREYLNKYSNQTEQTVEKELSDILPHYDIYCDKKRDYQLGNISKDIVLKSLQSVCQEISEFLHILYTSTDMPEEREMIKHTLSNIQF